MRPEWLLVALFGAGGAISAPMEQTPSPALLEFLGGWQVGDERGLVASLEFLDDEDDIVKLAKPEPE